MGRRVPPALGPWPPARRPGAPAAYYSAPALVVTYGPPPRAGGQRVPVTVACTITITRPPSCTRQRPCPPAHSHDNDSVQAGRPCARRRWALGTCVLGAQPAREVPTAARRVGGQFSKEVSLSPERPAFPTQTSSGSFRSWALA